MNLDTTAFLEAYADDADLLALIMICAGAAGAALMALMLIFWRSKTELEHRYAFLGDLREDLRRSFAAANRVLRKPDLPKPLRRMILFLVSGYADEARGKAFADFMLDHVAAGARDADKPSEDGISAAMEDLWRRDPDLAKEVHGILASLSFGLMMLNNIERFRVRRLEAETARAPDTLIQRLAGIIKRDLEDGPRPDGGGLRPI